MVAAAFGVAVAVLATGCGASDRSSKIASEIGANACTRTPYELKNRLDGSKSTIYDCTLNGRDMCVTEEGGIPRDSTAIVRVVFQGALGGDRPSCA